MVTIVVGETVPSDVENLTVSPESGFVPSITRAVTLDVMVEFAATVDGTAESVKVPDETVMVVCWVRVPHAAVTVAVPVSAPGVKVTHA